MPVVLLDQVNTSCVEAILQNGQLRRRGKSLTQQIISSEYILVAKILNLQLQQAKAKQDQNFLVSAIIGKAIVTNVNTLGTFVTLTRFSKVLPLLNNEAPRNYSGLSQSSLLISSENIGVAKKFIWVFPYDVMEIYLPETNRLLYISPAKMNFFQD